MVSVVPVAKLNVKACPAGTVNPLRVMDVHFTALATSRRKGQRVTLSGVHIELTRQ